MSKSTIKPVCMGHGLKRSYFSEKGHSSYMLLSSRSKSIFWKVHQSGQVWLWIQKVMPSGLKEVTLSYKLPLSNRWLAWFLLAGIYLYVRELDVFWAGQLEKPIPSLFSRGVRLQSLLTPISSALSFQCLASIHDSSFTFVGKIRREVWDKPLFSYHAGWLLNDACVHLWLCCCYPTVGARGFWMYGFRWWQFRKRPKFLDILKTKKRGKHSAD